MQTCWFGHLKSSTRKPPCSSSGRGQSITLGAAKMGSCDRFAITWAPYTMGRPATAMTGILGTVISSSPDIYKNNQVFFSEGTSGGEWFCSDYSQSARCSHSSTKGFLVTTFFQVLMSQARPRAGWIADTRVTSEPQELSQGGQRWPGECGSGMPCQQQVSSALLVPLHWLCAAESTSLSASPAEMRGFRAGSWTRQGEQPPAQQLCHSAKAQGDSLSILALCCRYQNPNMATLRQLCVQVGKVGSQPASSVGAHKQEIVSESVWQSWVKR